MRHESIIRMHKVYETADSVNVTFEYFGGGDVKKRVRSHGPFSERTAFIILAKVLRGIENLHEQRIIHRDIKAENVFLRFLRR